MGSKYGEGIPRREECKSIEDRLWVEGQVMMQMTSEKIWKGLRGLLIFAVAYQLFLSFFSIYSAGTLSAGYYFMPAIGQMINMILAVGLSVAVLYEIYWKNRKKEFLQTVGMFVRVENVLLVLFTVWMYISALFHLFQGEQNVFADNANAFNNVLIRFLLFFMFGQFLAGNKKVLHILFQVIVICATIGMGYVLIQLVFYETFYLPGGGIVYFNTIFTYGLKRLAINSHPNTTAMYAKAVLLICMYLYFYTKKRIRILYLGASVIHYIVLTLTASRAAIISSAVGFAAMIMLVVWRELRNKRMVVRFAVSLIVFSFFVGAFIGLRAPVVSGYKMLYNEFGRDRGVVEEIKEDAVMEYREMGSDISGRQLLFQAAIESMKDVKTAFFGVTPTGVVELIDNVSDLNWHVYTHNEFLEIMCAIGIPGLLFFVIWFIRLVWSGWTICFDSKNCFSLQEGLLVILCFSEALNNMMEAMLTFSSLLTGMLFYMTAGYLFVITGKKELTGK